ncbi:ferritin-like protein [Streptomyces sp. NRRL S-495]|uniref:ferritin-like domain-containing protein n=1 Tax=Streptomyces sp. NRRL S-495 TaxID=1609133 RepID=UPI000696E0C7|nr:ferritin-like protein [Streptomyces sp. NRRL S-495]
MTTGIRDYESDAIVQLMNMAEEDWTEQELKDALQRAIMLELSTIPPYATALWSITDPDNNKPVRHTIREIVFDEMSHFGLVCNMLTSIGGTVVLTDPATVPKYPGELPGGVNPGLEVYLSGLTRESAALFADIEKPEHPLAFATDGNTIGAFYQRIANVFPKFADLLTGRQQVTFPLGSGHGAGNNIVAMNTIDDVLGAIHIIQSQGEGTDASPENPFPGAPGELAHYYAFKEIAVGKKLVRDEQTGKYDFIGPDVPLPGTSPVARVPRGGWANSPGNEPDATTADLLHTFNQQYSEMLHALEDAWGPTGADIFPAIGLMGDLRRTAQKINGVKLPADPRFTYGPEWLFVQ